MFNYQPEIVVGVGGWQNFSTIIVAKLLSSIMHGYIWVPFITSNNYVIILRNKDVHSLMFK